MCIVTLPASKQIWSQLPPNYHPKMLSACSKDSINKNMFNFAIEGSGKVKEYPQKQPIFSY